MDPIPTPVSPLAFAGPTLLATIFSYLLMGVLIAQIVQYAQNTGASDRICLRLLVTCVAIGQILQLSFITQKAWRVLVLAFTTPALMNQQSTTAAGLPMLNGIVALGVQAFFAWRINSLRRDTRYTRPVPALVLVLALLQFSTAIPIGIAFVRSGAKSTAVADLTIFIPIHLTTQLVCDSLITVSMIALLWRIRKETQLRKTQTLLSTLIKHSIETGLITTACVAGNLAVYLLRKKDSINIVFQNVLGFLYAIVLLTTLNRRLSYRGVSTAESEFTEFSVRLNRLAFSTVAASGARTSQSPTAQVLAKGDQASALEGAAPTPAFHPTSLSRTVNERLQNDS
ncbi:hypothetical protein FA13DRAFT_1681287 [Coprinellus micaceus]|uniref:DUF6534 domain-containing protein n=1 Tax=Coprinellus micaceus TaxID=71717 RepID=A0A4Y7TVZ0_COPMI|nr:hypothetical protein FA13DRAFT_1681287 [Coprinellus micaceus]